MENPNKPKRIPKTLRLPLDVQMEIEEAAAKSGHSANEEIIRRLRAYAETVSLKDIAKQNAELKRMLQRLIDRHE